MTDPNSAKPTLPVGWGFPDGVAIRRRIERRLFVEIFLLDNKQYLYIFHDPDIRDRIISRKITHERFIVGGIQYVAMRYPDYAPEKLVSRLDEINNLRGLDAVAGMAELKSILIRDVIHPLQNKALYEKYKITIPNGVLFFGPPGCGKTFIARRLAEALQSHVVEVKGSDLGSSFIHETSKNIGNVFAKAFAAAPAVLFFDEISSLVPRRDGLGSQNQYKEAEISEFLMQLEGAGKRGVLVIGATNFPERIDPAIMRSGRMDKRIFIPPPDYNARIEMFRLMIDGRPRDKNILFEALGALTEGYVASDIQLLVDNAARAALAANTAINMEFIQQQIEKYKPSVAPDEIRRYLTLLDIERK